ISTRSQELTRRVLLTQQEQKIDLPENFEAVLVNEGGHGFYRVSLAADLLERLQVRGLQRLAPIERFNLLNDAWAMVQAGFLPLPNSLELTGRFRDERDKNVWAVIIGSFHILNRIVPTTPRPHFEALVRDRMDPAMKALRW